MPEHEFRQLAYLEDERLDAHFGVPLEQVTARRRHADIAGAA